MDNEIKNDFELDEIGCGFFFVEYQETDFNIKKKTFWEKFFQVFG